MNDDDILELRTRLQATMAEGGFTQVDVAKAIGLSQSVVSRFVKGQVKNPPPETLNRIRAFLGDELHAEVLSHEDVRRAVRLYRYVRGILEEGSQLVIRDKDGTEKIIIPLW
jgi:transcriptional regulator with XRE-family HTH domain